MSIRRLFPLFAVLTFLTVTRADEATPLLLIDPQGHSGVVKELLFRPSAN